PPPPAPRRLPSPYTTLFRSREDRVVERLDTEAQSIHAGDAIAFELLARHALGVALDRDLGVLGDGEPGTDPVERRGQVLGGHERSEEHTSELQSRFDLVCRL